MHQKHFVPADFRHRDQIVNGLTKGAEGLIVIEVANVLTDKCLPDHHQSD